METDVRGEKRCEGNVFKRGNKTAKKYRDKQVKHLQGRTRT